MDTLKIAKSFLMTAGLLASTVLVGCHHGDKPAEVRGQDFADENAPTSVGRMTQAQAAAGAKNDSMLYDMHFQGNELNSLGQTKLDLILKASPSGQPVTLYLNTTEVSPGKKATVLAYLGGAGVNQSQVKLVDGANPTATYPTAYTLPGIYKGANTTYDGSSADLGTGTSVGSVGK